MKLVDAHTHAWGSDTPELPWQADVLPPEWSGPYTHRDLVADMDRVGVDESVVVTTPLYGRGPRANEYTIRAIEAHPERLYGVGILDFFPADGDPAASVRRVLGHERMLGVRFHAAFEYAEIPTTPDPDADWILDDRLAGVFDALASLDRCAFVFPKPAQLPAVASLAETYPDTTFVVDHMGWPDEGTDPNGAPWTAFRDVAEQPNVYVKISSLPRSAAEPWPYPDLHPFVRNLLDWFGADRLMVGSDYPWMDSWADYERCLSWTEAVSFLSARDLSYLSHRTFERLHG